MGSAQIKRRKKKIIEQKLWRNVQPKRTMKKENKEVQGRNVNKITTLFQRKCVQQSWRGGRNLTQPME